MFAAVLALSLAASPFDRYASTRWTTEDGLPQSSVTSFAQDPDGWLYFGTFGGLVRFDGREFEVDDVSSGRGWPTLRITALAIDGDGTQWIGLQDGRVIRSGPGGDDMELPTTAPLFGNPIWSFASTDDGLWVAGSGGVARYDGDWHPLVDSGDLRVVLAVEDTVWIAGPGGLVRIDGGEPLQLSSSPVDEIRALAPSSDGIFAGGNDGVIELDDDGVHVLDRRPAERLARAADGTLFAASGNHVFVVGEPGELMLPSNVRDLFVGREQAVWVGTDADGLVRLVRADWELIGISSGVLPILEDDDGGLFVGYGCDPGGLMRISPTGEQLHLVDGCVRALARVPEGLLLGVDDVLTLWRPDGRVEPLHTLAHDIQVIRPSADGILVGTSTAGAFRIRDGRATPLDVGDRNVLAIEIDDRGAMWFGTQDGLSRIAGGELTRWTRADGVVAGAIRAVLPDRDGSVWLGSYGGGLGLLRDGSFHRFTTHDGLAENVVSSILDGRDGTLWLQGNRGLTRIARAELERHLLDDASRLSVRRWDTPEGNGGGAPAGIVLRDGSLALPTIEGVVRLDPREIFDNPVAPTLTVERASIDGFQLSTFAPIAVPAGAGRVELEFTAPILREPDLALFEVRVVSDNGPSDPPWERVDDTREVTYVGFPPGAYTIELRAANEIGVWSQTERLRFELAAVWYDRWPVRIGAIGGALALVVLVAWGRARILRSHLQRLEREVEQRAAAEEAMRRSEAHYRRVFEGSSDALFVIDRDRQVEQANAAATAMFAISPVGRVFDELFDDALDGVRRIRRGGPARWAAVVEQPFDRDRSLARAIDVTASVETEAERRTLEGRLYESRRMEAVGRLAGGIAHDFNNLLTAVRSTASAIESTLAGPGVRAETGPLLSTLDRCVDRGATLTRQLLAFARRQRLEPGPVDSAAVIVSVETMLRSLLRPEVELRHELPREPLGVLADASQLELALVDLVLNAIDAIQGPGVITIGVRKLDDATARAAWPELPAGPGPWVELRVADDGEGIEPQHLGRVLEPFFTTRPTGTGLGLASVHGFALQSGGALQVRSAPKLGTTVSLVLPWAEASSAHVEPAPRRDPSPASRIARVVVCDDDELVRSSLALILRRAGHEPLVYGDPVALLADVRDGLACDVMVTDVVMPGLSGPELAARVLELRPALPVVFVSGHTRELADAALPGRLLVKPFRTQDVLDAIADALVR